jgi:hypothetical protein
MVGRQISNSILHYTIIKFIIDNGYAPEPHELAALLQASEDKVFGALQRLQEDHGVVMHPHSPKIWVVHPFSLAPTNFLVHTTDGEWWANCAWCALGVAALLDRDVTITTTLGANDRQVYVHIQDGRVIETSFCIHFPVPMRQAWDNVIYTCSTMLLFENEQHIDRWCQQHRIPKGDVQSITKIWEFAKVWYGNHLNPDWKKWTAEEAQRIFEQFGLTDDIWKIPVSDTRF